MEWRRLFGWGSRSEPTATEPGAGCCREPSACGPWNGPCAFRDEWRKARGSEVPCPTWKTSFEGNPADSGTGPDGSPLRRQFDDATGTKPEADRPASPRTSLRRDRDMQPVEAPGAGKPKDRATAPAAGGSSRRPAEGGNVDPRKHDDGEAGCCRTPSSCGPWNGRCRVREEWLKAHGREEHSPSDSIAGRWRADRKERDGRRIDRADERWTSRERQYFRPRNRDRDRGFER
jgi:hypothetical protein